MNTLLTLKQDTDYIEKVFPKNIVLQSIFIIGGVIFKNNPTNLKKEKYNFYSKLIKTVSVTFLPFSCLCQIILKIQ